MISSMRGMRAARADGLRHLALAAIAALLLACDRSPTQPEPLTDCTILGTLVPAVLQVGETARMSAYLEHCRPMFLPLDSDRVGWQSLDPSVASVTTDTITAVARGVAVVQATFGRMTQQAAVVIGANGPQPPVPPRLRIYGCPEMSVLQRCTFGAFTVASDGAFSRVSTAATWRSSDPSVAGITVGTNGDQGVDGFSPGTARITATYQGNTTSIGVQVHPN
jgi:hypothetical protein